MNKLCHQQLAKKVIFWCTGLCLTTVAQGQQTNLITQTNLPTTVTETSGLVCSGPDTIYTHNDSQNATAIYQLNAQGQLQRTIAVSNATNIDWEDMARAPNGRFFVGDFGNNANTRQNLRVLILPNLDTLHADSVQAEFIYFHYPEQSNYPPAPAQLHYDVEAMVYLNDSLFLFTKNRTDPFDGYVKLYALPATAGTYAAALLDSFYVGPGPKEQYWVTAAALSPNQQQLYLLGYNRFWLFSCFSGSDFFSGAVRTESFNQASQKEGADFVNNESLLLTDEGFIILPPRLYQHRLNQWGAYPEPFANDTVSISAAGGTLHATPNMATYLWNDGLTDSVRAVGQAGWYSVVQTSANGCQLTDSVFVALVSRAQGAVPPSDYLIKTGANGLIALPTHRQLSRVHIFNATGKCVYEVLAPSPTTIQLPTGAWYIAVATFTNGTQRVQKLVLP